MLQSQLLHGHVWPTQEHREPPAASFQLLPKTIRRFFKVCVTSPTLTKLEKRLGKQRQPLIESFSSSGTSAVIFSTQSPSQECKYSTESKLIAVTKKKTVTDLGGLLDDTFISTGLFHQSRLHVMLNSCGMDRSEIALELPSVICFRVKKRCGSACLRVSHLLSHPSKPPALASVESSVPSIMFADITIARSGSGSSFVQLSRL